MPMTQATDEQELNRLIKQIVQLRLVYIAGTGFGITIEQE